MDASKLKNILEAGLLVAGRTMSIAQLEGLFEHDDEKPDRKQIREALDSLKEDYNGRGIELVEVASGFRLQSHESVADWVANLFQEKTPRYSRALLETLVLIAYRQPITRAEIEEVRGVAVSSNIVKTLQERQWVKVLGHKDVPGKPALLGTTKDFLDYFNLKKLDDLPSLAEVKDLDQFDALLADEVGEVEEQGDAANDSDDSSSDTSADFSSELNSNEEGGASADDESAADDESITDDADIDASSDDDVSAENADTEEHGSDDDSDNELSADSTDDDSADDNSSAELDSASDSTDDAEQSDEESDVQAKVDGDETLSGPELELLRVISDFSDEHQQQIDARDEIEAGILSSNTDSNEEDDVESIGDLSQRISDDSHSGDGPEPGDTLH